MLKKTAWLGIAECIIPSPLSMHPSIPIARNNLFQIVENFMDGTGAILAQIALITYHNLAPGISENLACGTFPFPPEALSVLLKSLIIPSITSLDIFQFWLA